MKDSLIDIHIIVIYIVCDELLKSLNYSEDHQALMANSEVMAFSIIAAQLFGGNHARCHWFCRKDGCFPNMLSKSRLNRRLHKIPWMIWMSVFRILSLIFINDNTTKEYSVDSFPIACCKKSRIDKRHIFLGKEYIGFAASEQRYFCGIKVHMIVKQHGEPVELMFRPASENDITVLWKMNLYLPMDSKLYADGAYNCYDLEDILKEDSKIYLMAKRPPKSKRMRTREEELHISSQRQIVETAFSCITGIFPRYIKVCTEKGFLIRVMSAILAYSTSFMF